MPDDADLIERYSDAVWQILTEMHKVGIRYVVIHQMLIETTKSLEIQGYAENWLSEYNKDTSIP